ncbi:MAG: hypothetical protein JXR76_11620 [Deltaproteobacteria bacterium]|nr:hypothetical protein [Deltaproteobacteria bacterium]
MGIKNGFRFLSVVFLVYTTHLGAQEIDNQPQNDTAGARLEIGAEGVSADGLEEDAESEENGAEGDKDGEKGKKKKKKVQNDAPRFIKKLSNKSKREIKGRVFAYYQFSDREGKHNRLVLDVARLNLAWRYGRVAEAVLKYDFAGLVRNEEIKDGLRDAYVRIEPAKFFGLQMGQFKKPFSRIELTSRGKLSAFSRGAANSYAVGFLGFGDRDLGLMVSGRLIKHIKLDYFAGIFNGVAENGIDVKSSSFDYTFRLEASPAKWLELGAAASAHRVTKNDFGEFFDASEYEELDDNDFPDWINPDERLVFGSYQEYALKNFKLEYPWLSGTHWMGEVDAELEFGDFCALIEFMGGQNWWFKYSPWLWSITTLFSYKIPLFDGVMAVEPVFFAELLNISDDDWAWRARMLQLSPGVNVHFGDDFRLMVHGQITRTKPGSDAEDEINEAGLAGFWPGEWPGSFESANAIYIQLGFAN